MSEPRRGEDESNLATGDAPEEPRLLALLGDLPARSSALLFALLAFFPPAIALVGSAIAYELTQSLSFALAGAAFGAATGFAWSRDFARWRVSPLTAALSLMLGALFIWAYFA